jgi:hypothetical protein
MTVQLGLPRGDARATLDSHVTPVGPKIGGADSLNDPSTADFYLYDGMLAVYGVFLDWIGGVREISD